MHLYFDNVEDAFASLVEWFGNPVNLASGILVQEDSRVGPVIRMLEPLTVTYHHPQERVLFNTERDCNPFFHIFEAMWMLGGSNKVSPLVYFNPQMAEYSDDGTTLHGAYGYRWRKYFGYDQLTVVADHLTKYPNTRRAVLAMWDAGAVNTHMVHQPPSTVQPGDGHMLQQPDSKDLPCNTHIYFTRRQLTGKPSAVLDMTVVNRSNDVIWGMLGANVVHMSFLQEWMAAAVGWKVGYYHQVTNNAHVYCNRFDPKRWLSHYRRNMHSPPIVKYKDLSLCPLVEPSESPLLLLQECMRFVDYWGRAEFTSAFLRCTVQPMLTAFKYHKLRRYAGEGGALWWLERIAADDWRIAATQWIKKRRETYAGC